MGSIVVGSPTDLVSGGRRDRIVLSFLRLEIARGIPTARAVPASSIGIVPVSSCTIVILLSTRHTQAFPKLNQRENP